MNRMVILLYVALCVGCVLGDDAAFFKWAGGEGNFSDAANWTVGGNANNKWTVDGEAATHCPGASDSIFFPRGTSKVVLTEDTAVYDLNMYGNLANTNSVTIDLGGKSLEILNVAESSSRIDCEVMEARTCSLTLTNGVFTYTNAPSVEKQGLLLGNRSYNHNGTLTLSDMVFTGNVHVAGTSRLTVENGTKWFLPKGQGFGGADTKPEWHAETVIRGFGTSVCTTNGTLGLPDTYGTLTISNHAAFCCYQFYVNQNKVDGPCVTIADCANVTNKEATYVGCQPGQTYGNSFNTIVVTNNSYFHAGNCNFGADYGSTGCCVRVTGGSAVRFGTIRLFGMVSNTLDIVDSVCTNGGQTIIGRDLDRVDFDNGISMSGANSHFVAVNHPFINYENTRSFIAFDVPEDGFVLPDGNPRVPMELNVVSNLVKTAGYATSSPNRIRVRAAEWARKNPRKTITLISCRKACEKELKVFAENAELDDPRITVAVVDGKSITVTALGKGTCIVVR